MYFKYIKIGLFLAFAITIISLPTFSMDASDSDFTLRESKRQEIIAHKEKVKKSSEIINILSSKKTIAIEDLLIQNKEHCLSFVSTFAENYYLFTNLPKEEAQEHFFSSFNFFINETNRICGPLMGPISLPVTLLKVSIFSQFQEV